MSLELLTSSSRLAAPAPAARFSDIPVTLFGMVLGLGGLTNAWRAAEALWNLPPGVGNALAGVTCALWGGCAVGLIGKAAWARSALLRELQDPSGGALFALVPMATLVVSLVVQPTQPEVAWWLFSVGSLGQVGVGVWSTAGLWRGDRELHTINSALLMPTVGGFFVSAVAASKFDAVPLGVLFFGAGLGSWLVTESVVLQRLILQALPRSSRATLGIHLTPPAIASVAYLSLSHGAPDRFAQMLFGYAVLQGFVTLRLLPWLREQPFGLGTWAYTFGLSALAIAAIRFGSLGQVGPIAALAAPLFVFANGVILSVALRTLVRALRVRVLASRVP